MKNKFPVWIDALDKQLLSCREGIEDLIFKRDMGLPVDIRNIKLGYIKQKKILSGSKFLNELDKSCPRTIETKRKIEILKRKIVEVKVSDSPELQFYQNFFQKEMTDFFLRNNLTLAQRAKFIKESDKREERRENFSLMNVFLDKQKNNFRKMILLANKLAKKENFPDFYSAKSFSEENNPKKMTEVLYRVKRKTDKVWKLILKKIKKVVGYDNLEQYDLYYGINQLSNQTKLLPGTNFLSSLKLKLSALGVDFNKLPIKVTGVVNAPPAGVYALGLPRKSKDREITIAIDPGAGWNSYAFLFHEFGHAIYYAFSPSSFLLTDSHLSREVMAEMWVGFIEQPEWLILNEFAQKKKMAEEIINSKLIWDVFQLRSQILETEFELNIYSDPECDFKNVWRSLSRDILGVDDRLGIYSEFVFIHPFDIKDYVLAWEAKKTFIDFINRKYGNLFNNPQIVDFLISRLYSPGAIIPWDQKLSLLNY